MPILVFLGGVGIALLLTGRATDPSVLPGRLPLFAVSLAFAFLVLGLSILLTWCYNSTDGSVLLAMLLHAGFNSSGAFVPVPMEAMEGSPATLDAGITVGVWVVAIAVIARTGTETLSRRGPPDAAVAGREFDREPGASEP